jgi:chromate reductase
MAADVAVLVGSLRRGSYNRRLALAIAALAPPTLSLEIVDIRDLALYDEDLEADAPPSWRALRERVRRAEAVLFVTPEYNRSVPGALKNALDVASRPTGHSAWKGKPCAVISLSPGAIGGFGANHHLRQSLVFLDMPVLQQPEAYLGNAARLFDADGGIREESTREFVRGFVEAFARFVTLHLGK